MLWDQVNSDLYKYEKITDLGISVFFVYKGRLCIQVQNGEVNPIRIFACLMTYTFIRSFHSR